MKNIKSTLLITSLALSTNVNAALIERLDGLAYYDDVHNLTWLANANPTGSRMTWQEAMDWAEGLSVNGVTGWRLPDYTHPFPGPYYNELQDMFYDTLGGTSGVPISVSHNANYDYFSNIMDDRYWTTATETMCEGGQELCGVVFNMSRGITNSWNIEYSIGYAWAVYDGDVVPVPAAVWLFGSGLIGLIGVARRKRPLK